jgi:hypothetical protein
MMATEWKALKRASIPIRSCTRSSPFDLAERVFVRVDVKTVGALQRSAGFHTRLERIEKFLLEGAL